MVAIAHGFDNSTNPIEETFKVYAVKNEQGRDLVSTQTLNVFIPRTPQQPTHDQDGNMTGDGIHSFSWDAENRLKEANNTLKNEKGAYAYDYKFRRTEKKIYNGENLSSHTKFTYDGWNLIAELDGANAVVKRYIWGEDISGTLQGAGGVGGLLAEINSHGIFFPCYDSNGNIVAYVGTDGKIAAAYEYDAFGRLISKSGPLADEFSFRFSTKYFDKETGNYYYGYRYYSPNLKRWLSRDPIGENGGYNLYCMNRNNSISSLLSKINSRTVLSV